MGAPEQCHCPRCKRDVRVERPWRGFRILWRGWLGLVVLLGLTAPIWATDLMVMMPTACFILLAGGSLSTYAKQPPTCRRCKLELTDPLPSAQSVQPF
jgi:hypothetical protein